ncbi:hypothetical protein RIF29_29124 [Crotalaria pallida]|uniref:Uncharacterized protein n=1 Tax=Crotalaria pallida TaxID=3830 RepID=A0AAN9EJ61_CROPI
MYGFPSLSNDLLGRSLINAAWCASWPDSETTFMLPDLSNFSPILVEWNQVSWSPKIDFKYFNMWAEHSGFLELVKSVWQSDIQGYMVFQVCKKLDLLKQPLKSLNKAHFSGIVAKEQDLKSRLNFIQGLLVQNPSDISLQNEEKEIF